MKLVREAGIEPTPELWKSPMLTIEHYSRIIGGLGGTRTHISQFAKLVFYHCYYQPILAETEGLEPSTLLLETRGFIH